MKKILFLGLILTLVAGVASAQVTSRGDRFRQQKTLQSFRQGDLNRYELRKLHRENKNFKSARRRANRDGRVTPFERRRLSAMKKHQRHDYMRFKHNRHRRVI